VTDKEYDTSKLWVSVTYEGVTLYEGQPSIMKMHFKDDIEAISVTASRKIAKAGVYDEPDATFDELEENK
jgi:hypothetical protein